MQTFSSMRRNRTDKKNLRILFLVLGVIVYVSISDIYYFLPPLFGVAYVLAQEKFESNDTSALYWFLPFFVFFETNKELPFLSTILFMAFSFKIVLPKFRKFFGYSKVFIPLFIAYAYFGYFVFLNLMGLLFDYDMPKFSWFIVFYVGVEMVLIWFFLWVF